MCGIAGFSSWGEDYKESPKKWEAILRAMNQAQKHRGPDEEGLLLTQHCGLAHVRLSIIDLSTGHQPMTKFQGGRSCSIIYNGEVYNAPELKTRLQSQGVKFETTSDTEVVLAGFMRYGCDFVKELNGIFAFAIWDNCAKKIFLFRDRLGVKPLFYTLYGKALLFSSEIKGLFQYPGMEAAIDQEGLCEIFGLGPAKTGGKGVFKNVYEVRSGHFMEFDREGLREHSYWKLNSVPHEDSYEMTVEKTRFLIEDAVKKQMRSDVPICTFLSGGVDSSIVTAICARELKKEGKQINTFSFDFKNNDKNFKANTFQPSQDRPWVDKMIADTGSNHQYLECNNTDLFGYLQKAVEARDLPCMADVESSMLYFCEKVALRNKVTLTGECADEIFGGYPWFHKKECFEAKGFPWSMDFEPRKMLLKEEVLRELPLEAYARAAYEQTVSETPRLPGEDAIEGRRREISYLNLKWFMVTLLDRMDRTSMRAGLEARVPFADHRIVEYLWNVPWAMKNHDNVVKGLLRDAGRGILPNEVLFRKKSPYPKTYDPIYEKLVRTQIKEVLAEGSAPLNTLIDRKKMEHFLSNDSDYGRPFYGQLMAGPQLLGYLLQINDWLLKYKVRII